MNIPSSKKTLIVIGGGFAGISLIKQLKITGTSSAFDKQYHTFQPLYQVTAGLEPDSIVTSTSKIFRNHKIFTL
jgi:NADH dehydrogenase